VVLEVEDILKEFDESIQRDEKEAGKVADGPGDNMETGDMKQEVIDEAEQAKEAAAEEDIDAADAAEEADAADEADTA
jgi:hypothetical protein